MQNPCLKKTLKNAIEADSAIVPGRWKMYGGVGVPAPWAHCHGPVSHHGFGPTLSASDLSWGRHVARCGSDRQATSGEHQITPAALKFCGWSSWLWG
eukprot:364557-Chlamydomonas_euryale.AAC.11